MTQIAFGIRAKGVLLGFSALLFFYSSLQAKEIGSSHSIAKRGSTLPMIVVATTGDDSIDSDRMVHQQDVGDCACGPCAIFNAFQFGNSTLTNLAGNLQGTTPAQKVRSLINMFGGKPSCVAHNQPRYLSDGGMWDDDIAPFINDWLRRERLGPRVHGERLVLKKGETPQEQLRRVYHDLRHSLAAGFPPVVNLQSYAEDINSRRDTWNWLDGHFVAVVAVQEPLPDHAGFSMWVADSQTGRVLKVSVCAGDTPFRAITDKRVRNGKEIDQWSGGYPYLTIRSPKLEGVLEGDAARSHPQIICVLQFLAHR